MKVFKKLAIVLSAILALSALVAVSACAKQEERTTYEGHYHSDVTVSDTDDTKRGCDLFVILNPDKSIYTIALDDNSVYQCADKQVPWSIKSSGYFNNLANLGIDGIKALKVNFDETTGLPNEIVGMDVNWLVPANTAGCGYVVLALQDAFKNL